MRRQEEDDMNEKRTGRELLIRYIFLGAGLAIMAFGVAFSIKASLGTSPISSLPYVVSLFTPLTVGNLTILMHIFFILLQIFILGKDYQWIQLIQLPVAIVFGYLTDLAVWATSGITCTAYWQQWIVCLAGILLVGIGVSFEVTANVVVLAGEGVVLAVCRRFKLPFANMKIAFDVTLVVSSVILSLIFLHSLQGVREGTVAAALCVGLVARFFNSFFKKINIQKVFSVLSGH